MMNLSKSHNVPIESQRNKNTFNWSQVTSVPIKITAPSTDIQPWHYGQHSGLGLGVQDLECLDIKGRDLVEPVFGLVSPGLLTLPYPASLSLAIPLWAGAMSTSRSWNINCIIGMQDNTIRPLSDTVPLWSGNSFGAFVYVGNDGCMFCSWL